jgi:CheY-like chemotaxis protein
MIVDLDKESDAIDLIRRLRDQRATPAQREIRIVAFGPHVRRDLLQQAREAGADEVLTRGTFDHGLDVILLRLAGRADA